MSEPLVRLMRKEAGTFHNQRRKRLARLCLRAADSIAAGERDPLLCAEFRAWGIASDRKGRHGLAGKLFAAAAALE